MVKSAVRLDDISADMDYEKFNRFRKILESFQIRPLIGVVVDNRDPKLCRSVKNPDFALFLQELQKQGYQIALHGYRHVYTTKKSGLFPLNRQSEFAGIPYDKQEEMIRHGKEMLKEMGIETDIFMAPSHSYDRNTLKALKKNGFTAVTDGFGKYPYQRDGLIFYPIAFKKSDCFSNKEGYTTLVVHTNSIEDAEFEQYEQMIRHNRDCFISYEEYRKAPYRKRGAAGNWMEWMAAVLKYVLVRARMILNRK